MHPAKTNAQMFDRHKGNLITTVAPVPLSTAFLDLRIYDRRSSIWFISLSLSKKQYPHFDPVIFHRCTNSKHCEIEATVPFFGPQHLKYKLILTAYVIVV